MSKLVQTSLNVFTLVQTCSYLSKLVQACSSLSNFVLTWSYFCEFVQIWSNLFRTVLYMTNCDNFDQLWPIVTIVTMWVCQLWLFWPFMTIVTNFDILWKLCSIVTILTNYENDYLSWQFRKLWPLSPIVKNYECANTVINNWK